MRTMNARTVRVDSDHQDLDHLAPYRSLVAAVLRKGLLDATSMNKGERVPAWVWMHDDSDAPMSFEWCCSVVGLDPEEVRARVVLARREVGKALRNTKPRKRVASGKRGLSTVQVSP